MAVLVEDPERYYGFSTFAVELNEVSSIEEGFLPLSDSRLRPDQLALENGDVESAEILKKRVEEKQRAKRGNGAMPIGPQWFVKDGDGWKFGGKYCELGVHLSFVRCFGADDLSWGGDLVEKRETKSFRDPDIF